MKPSFQFLGIIAVGAVIAFAFTLAGCDNMSGFYDEATPAGKLESFTPNTVQDPYTIALDSSVSINMGSAATRDAAKEELL
jgi:hypothetical protein